MSIEDIKPDTSLYTDLPSRFRALALVVEGWAKGKPVQIKCAPNAEWEPTSAPQWMRDPEYRLAPAPRTVFIVFTPDGERWQNFETEQAAELASSFTGGTYAKFVEVLP